MENNSTQGIATLVLFLAFLFWSIGFYQDGNILAFLAGFVALGAGIVMFRKAKAMEAGQ